jgi:hypothetical protein
VNHRRITTNRKTIIQPIKVCFLVGCLLLTIIASNFKAAFKTAPAISSIAITAFQFLDLNQLKLRRGGMPQTAQIVRQGMTTKYERNSA